MREFVVFALCVSACATVVPAEGPWSYAPNAIGCMPLQQPLAQPRVSLPHLVIS